MVENTQSIKKELNVADKALEKIASQTAQHINGILSLTGGPISNLTDRFMNSGSTSTKGVDVDVEDDDSLSFELKAILEYGKSAPQIFEQVVQNIARSVKQMTGKNISKITLTVDDLLTESEWRQKQSDSQKEDQQEQD